MKKSILKAIPILAISGTMLFAQYYDQNSYNTQNNYASENSYGTYYNYYDEFMKVLAREASNPSSIYYSPVFSKQYNNYNQMNYYNPYQQTMNAMNTASETYNNASQNYYGTSNPYEELMKMLERESKNPNSPYYSPNYQNNNAYQNDYYQGYDNNNAYQDNSYYQGYDNNNAYQDNSYYQGYDNNNAYQDSYYQEYQNNNDYAQTNASENPYQAAAEALIKAAEELSQKADTTDNYNNYNTQTNQSYNNNQNYDFYTPFKVPKAVFNTANQMYPDAKIIDIEMENIGIYEVKLNNMMRLYIDRNGQLLNQKFEY
ncbi:PepSY-like domain-containing protein [Brachyspira pulli]|uniref:PepSY-like domain-containing protein n=1 Tax=Brachyspira pulli TaxID=310721 RepID=UPI0030060394